MFSYHFEDRFISIFWGWLKQRRSHCHDCKIISSNTHRMIFPPNCWQHVLGVFLKCANSKLSGKFITRQHFWFCLNIFTAKAAGQSGSSVVRTHTAQIKIRQMSIPNKMRVFIFFLPKGIRKEKFNTWLFDIFDLLQLHGLYSDPKPTLSVSRAVSHMGLKICSEY